MVLIFAVPKAKVLYSFHNVTLNDRLGDLQLLRLVNLHSINLDVDPGIARSLCYRIECN